METKTCSKCKLEKPAIEFNKDKSNQDGYKGQCKTCIADYNRRYKNNNRDNINTYRRQWKHDNRERENTKLQQYRIDNKEHVTSNYYEWRNNNLDRIQTTNSNWYLNNKDYANTRAAVYESTRKKNDINYYLKKLLRSRLYNAIKNNQKVGSAVKDLGCTIEEFKIYLENLFQSGMTWDNRGQWHIDHILPLASFDLTDPTQFKVACHYTNLQPLWAKDNLSKGDKVLDSNRV